MSTVRQVKSEGIKPPRAGVASPLGGGGVRRSTRVWQKDTARWHTLCKCDPQIPAVKAGVTQPAVSPAPPSGLTEEWGKQLASEASHLQCQALLWNCLPVEIQSHFVSL